MCWEKGSPEQLGREGAPYSSLGREGAPYSSLISYSTGILGFFDKH